MLAGRPVLGGDRKAEFRYAGGFVSQADQGGIRARHAVNPAECGGFKHIASDASGGCDCRVFIDQIRRAKKPYSYRMDSLKAQIDELQLRMGGAGGYYIQRQII
jgi:hypothetical protein